MSDLQSEKKEKNCWNILSCSLVNHFCNFLVLLAAGHCTVSQLNDNQRGKINRNFKKIKKDLSSLAVKQKCIFHFLGKVKWNEEDSKIIKRIINKIKVRSPDFTIEQVNNQQVVQKGSRELANDQFKDPLDDTCLKLIE